MDNVTEYSRTIANQLGEKAQARLKDSRLGDMLVAAGVPFVEKSISNPIISKGIKHGLSKVGDLVNEKLNVPTQFFLNKLSPSDSNTSNFDDTEPGDIELQDLSITPDTVANMNPSDIVDKLRNPQYLSNDSENYLRQGLAKKTTYDTSDQELNADSTDNILQQPDITTKVNKVSSDNIAENASKDAGDVATDTLEEATADSLAEDAFDPFGLIITGVLGLGSLISGAIEADKPHMPTIATASSQFGVNSS